MRLLVTGFGAFGPVINNPTERLTAHLAASAYRRSGISAICLGVAYRSVLAPIQRELERAESQETPYDAVLMTGVATNRICFSVELFGRNQMNCSLSDNDGYVPDRRQILPRSANMVLTTLPRRSLIDSIRRSGLNAELSRSAGDFLCNYVLYTTLALLQSRHSKTVAGFLHVPADNQTFAEDKCRTNRGPFSDHVRALDATIAAIRESLPSSPPGVGCDL